MEQHTIQHIENYVEKETKGLSPVHGFCHLKRTAIGAKWFSQIFGGTKEEQDIAYIAGLLHDMKRPDTSTIDHTEISVEATKSVLHMFSVDSTIAEKIVQQVSEHRTFHDTPVLYQSVFLSDKLLEQSGAYIIFRRNYHVGENVDYAHIPFEEAISKSWTQRLARFSPEKFAIPVRAFAFYQYKQATRFFSAFQQHTEWAQSLAKDFYLFGQDTHAKDLDALITSYRSSHNDIQELQQEASDYIHGKKYSAYESMIHVED